MTPSPQCGTTYLRRFVASCPARRCRSTAQHVAYQNGASPPSRRHVYQCKLHIKRGQYHSHCGRQPYPTSQQRPFDVFGSSNQALASPALTGIDVGSGSSNLPYIELGHPIRECVPLVTQSTNSLAKVSISSALTALMNRSYSSLSGIILSSPALP